MDFLLKYPKDISKRYIVRCFKSNKKPMMRIKLGRSVEKQKPSAEVMIHLNEWSNHRTPAQTMEVDDYDLRISG